jgi:hypothetical protein
VTIDELNRELAATDEAYVRRKLSIGGYSTAQAKHVQAWLLQREQERAAEREKQSVAASSRTAFWTMIAAIGGMGGFVIAVITALVTKSA